MWFLVHSMPKTTIPVTNNIQGFLSDWKCDFWIKVVHVMLHRRWHMVTTVFTRCPPPATLQHTNRLSLNYITAISTMNCVNVDWYKMDEADTSLFRVWSLLQAFVFLRWRHAYKSPSLRHCHPSYRYSYLGQYPHYRSSSFGALHPHIVVPLWDTAPQYWSSSFGHCSLI